MNTNGRSISVIRHSLSSRLAVGSLVAALLSTLALSGAAGCGPHLATWMYTLGLVPKQEVKAEYRLPQGPLLILVDDFAEWVQPPFARYALVDELARQFKDHKLVAQVTTNEQLARMRQADSELDQRTIRQVGQRADADTVLWINPQEYEVDDDLETVSTPARFAVKVKVFNARAERTEDVRLWPAQRDGRLVEASVKPHDIRTCKTKTEVHQKVAAALADQIARLFYDYEVQQ